MRYDHSYELGMPEVTDIEYDILKSGAKAAFPDHPYFQQVGADVQEGNKVRLPHVLGSLNKVKGIDGTYDSWANRYSGEMVYWAKLDGCSLFVEYEDGKFVRAMTRGDGEYGQDVTDKARKFVKLELDEPCTVELRAEVMLTGNFHRELGYKTRRNGTAGMLNSDSTANCEKLTVMYYELISDDDFGVPHKETARIRRMVDMGLDVAPNVRGTGLSSDELIEVLRNWKTELPYDIDGLVITPNDSIREDAMYPENKIAFKVNEEATLCNVVGVEWSVGRTGRVTPVVVIEPEEIGGVTVERATGFNAEFIVDQGIDEGAVIGIYRSGDVIPYIDYTETSVWADYPEFCPSCGGEVRQDGVDVICDNNNCPDKNVQIVEHFLRTLGCENVTATTLKKLDVYSVKAAYDLDEFEISMLDGFGIKRAEQIVAEIRKTLKTTPDKLLASFGISGIGKSVSQNILKKYDFEDLFEKSAWEFETIDGIGETLAQNLVSNLPSRKGMYQYLLSEGLQWASSTNNLRGKTFCLTGNGTVKRDLLVKMIEQNGGYVKGISRNVDVLVSANPNSNSGKAKKAREYGIEIIGYEDLMGMLEY
jgi:DNA ligase (NAD+)